MTSNVPFSHIKLLVRTLIQEFNSSRVNHLSRNIPIQILQTHLHAFSWRIIWKNLIKDQSTFSLVLTSSHNVSFPVWRKLMSIILGILGIKGWMFLPVGYSWFAPLSYKAAMLVNKIKHFCFFRRIYMKMSLVPSGKRSFILVSRHGRCEVRRSAKKRFPRQSVKFTSVKRARNR